MTTQPEPRRPSEPSGFLDAQFADPDEAAPLGQSWEQPAWEQPPFGPAAYDGTAASHSVAPTNEVLSGEVIVPPRVTTGQQWLVFLRRWGIPVAVLLALFANWWIMWAVVVILAVLPRIVADLPRKSVRPGDPQADMRARRYELNAARQQYRLSARQARLQRRMRR